MTKYLSEDGLRHFWDKIKDIFLKREDISDWAKQTDKPEYKLSDLGDTNISKPEQGNVLIYNSETEKWIASEPSGGGGDEKLAVSSIQDPGTSRIEYDLLVTDDSDETKTSAKTRKFTDSVKVGVIGDTSSEVSLNVGGGTLGFDGLIKLTNSEDSEHIKVNSNSIVYNDGTYESRLMQNTLSDYREIHFPDASGTIALMSDIPTQPSDIGAQPEGNYKTKQNKKDDPAVSNSASMTFISKISQNKNGEIAATKEKLPSSNKNDVHIETVGQLGSVDFTVTQQEGVYIVDCETIEQNKNRISPLPINANIDNDDVIFNKKIIVTSPSSEQIPVEIHFLKKGMDMETTVHYTYDNISGRDIFSAPNSFNMEPGLSLVVDFVCIDSVAYADIKVYNKI